MRKVTHHLHECREQNTGGNKDIVTAKFYLFLLRNAASTSPSFLPFSFLFKASVGSLPLRRQNQQVLELGQGRHWDGGGGWQRERLSQHVNTAGTMPAGSHGQRGELVMNTGRVKATITLWCWNGIGCVECEFMVFHSMHID